ncbi:MAG: hypothetical protein JWO38_2565 [Gemmataceae bacterium]|nr:hypothetical protein [Gemmataceae bacterium]
MGWSPSAPTARGRSGGPSPGPPVPAHPVPRCRPFVAPGAGRSRCDVANAQKANPLAVSAETPGAGFFGCERLRLAVRLSDAGVKPQSEYVARPADSGFPATAASVSMPGGRGEKSRVGRADGPGQTGGRNVDRPGRLDRLQMETRECSSDGRTWYPPSRQSGPAAGPFRASLPLPEVVDARAMAG